MRITIYFFRELTSAGNETRMVTDMLSNIDGEESFLNYNSDGSVKRNIEDENVKRLVIEFIKQILNTNMLYVNHYIVFPSRYIVLLLYLVGKQIWIQLIH